MNRASVFRLILFFAVISMCSCKKGDVGPRGEPGTANVIYSEWFTPDSYQSTMIFGIRNLTYDKAAPKITQEVLDSSVVLVYGKLLGYSPAIWPVREVGLLPITLTYQQGGETMSDTWSARSSVGNLQIQFVNTLNYYTSLVPLHQFRYVIVPGGQKLTLAVANGGPNGLGGANAVLADDYAGMSYEEVCARFNIPQ